MRSQVHLLDYAVDQSASNRPLYALDTRKKVQVLDHSQLLKDSVVLRAVADALACKAEPSLHVPAANADAPTSRHRIIRQTLEHCRLSSTVNAEERETFSLLEAERDIVDSCQVLAEASLEDFLELVYSDRHVFCAQRCNSLFFFKDIVVFHFDTWHVGRDIAIGVLDLATSCLVAALEDEVEGSRPAVAVNYRLKKDYEDNSDAEVAD